MKNRFGPESKYLKYIGKWPTIEVTKYIGDSRMLVRCSCCEEERIFAGKEVEKLIKEEKTFICGSCSDIKLFNDKYLNKRFGRIVILDRIVKKGLSYYKFKCDCGKVKKARSSNIISGKVRGCGCSVHAGKKVEINGRLYRRIDLAKKFNVPYARIGRNIKLGKTNMDILFWKKEIAPSLSNNSKLVKKNKNLFVLRKYGMRTIGDIAMFMGISHQRLYQKIKSGHDIVSEFKNLYEKANGK